eukprot:m.76370 g.76370  ORF g.76370 m.76370 type:complete len:305 (-) comp14633_c0_seq2:204-1118(-)
MANATAMIAVAMCVLLAMAAAPVAATRPVVLWHGMGDSCCNPLSMGAIKREIQKTLPNTYVHSVEVGDNPINDELHSFIGNVNSQIDEVCKQLQNDSNLADGFNAVGFSQGGQFLRAYVQRCNNPPVHNLITFGGQHMGVAAMPHCLPGMNKTLCDLMAQLLAMGAYSPLVRDVSVQAQYYRSSMDFQKYLSDNIFLPDINNEKDEKNSTYVENLTSLNKLVLIMFANDTMVVPRESSHFAAYAVGSLTEVVPLQEQQLYTEDWLGLKELDTSGRIDMLECPGDHMQISMQYFHDEVILPYLNN